jgi:hypothetical protein
MSQSHIRVRREAPPAKPHYVFVAFVFCALVAVCASIFWSNFRGSMFWETHSAAEGQVSETRVVVDRIIDSTYGGRVLYRLEAHVRFMAEGQMQERWMVVREDTHDRALLMAEQASNPKTCEVYWTSGHPEDAGCMFQRIR